MVISRFQGPNIRCGSPSVETCNICDKGLLEEFKNIKAAILVTAAGGGSVVI